MQSMIEKVTAQDCKDAVAASGINAWQLRECSICGTPLCYLFGTDGTVVYDSNCDCVTYRSPYRPASWDDIADIFNMQTPEVRARMWASFAGPQGHTEKKTSSNLLPPSTSNPEGK